MTKTIRAVWGQAQVDGFLDGTGLHRTFKPDTGEWNTGLVNFKLRKSRIPSNEDPAKYFGEITPTHIQVRG